MFQPISLCETCTMIWVILIISSNNSFAGTRKLSVENVDKVAEVITNTVEMLSEAGPSFECIRADEHDDELSPTVRRSSSRTPTPPAAALTLDGYFGEKYIIPTIVSIFLFFFIVPNWSGWRAIPVGEPSSTCASKRHASGSKENKEVKKKRSEVLGSFFENYLLILCYKGEMRVAI